MAEAPAPAATRTGAAYTLGEFFLTTIFLFSLRSPAGSKTSPLVLPGFLDCRAPRPSPVAYAASCRPRVTGLVVHRRRVAG